MNGSVLLVLSVVLFGLAYAVYGRYLRRILGVDPSRRTPAHTHSDGLDYVPTKLPVLFGHHFASIAGAGPIVGPIAAAYFGWAPVALWIVIGCIFVGATHDFAALFVSVRAEGRSIGHVIERQLGFMGRQIFLLFCFAALLLVVAVFAVLVAGTFVSKPSVATASLLFIFMAPVFGYLVYRRSVSLVVASCIFVPLLFVFVWVGEVMPLDLSALTGVDAACATKIWLGVLAIYVFVASVIPVWVLLQPRDYLNSYLLYAMLALGFVGILLASPQLEAPSFSGWVVTKGNTPKALFPILFVTVACGACSGFHALVASGTTSKQLADERHIQPIGYGAMLVEGVLAIMALVSVCYLGREAMAETIAAKKPVVAFAMGLAHFCQGLGIPASVGESFFALAISAFLLTTLDTATRLSRFTWQELFLPRCAEEQSTRKLHGVFSNRFSATAIVIIGAGCLAVMKRTTADGAVIPAWRIIWPVFGASNQLLAALTLLVVTVILMRNKKNFWVTLIPMCFMMVVCLWALGDLLSANSRGDAVNLPIAVATLFLLIMAGVLIVRAFVALIRQGKGLEADG